MSVNNNKKKETEITAEDIADYIICFAHEHHGFISNLKLQKLLYYTQGWYLAINDEPLFEDDFEAWIHGPTIREIYRRYKKYTYKNIDEEPEMPNLPDEIKGFLDEVLEEYFDFDAFTLERMTHRELPWLSARGDLPKDISSKTIIDKTDMKKYFSRLLEENEQAKS